MIKAAVVVGVAVVVVVVPLAGVAVTRVPKTNSKEKKLRNSASRKRNKRRMLKQIKK